MAEVYGDRQFFEKIEYVVSPICSSATCINFRRCMMNYNGPDTDSAVAALATITVAANEKFREFLKFKKSRLPTGTPIFRLIMLYCPNRSPPEIDMGD